MEHPEELSKLIIGIYEGTILGRFELKPAYEIAIAPFPTPENMKPKAKTNTSHSEEDKLITNK